MLGGQVVSCNRHETSISASGKSKDFKVQGYVRWSWEETQ